MLEGKYFFKLILLFSALFLVSYSYGMPSRGNYGTAPKENAGFIKAKKILKSDPVNSDSGKTAGEFYKNIKALKDIPASRLIPTMHFIEASLGMNCGNCHVRDREKGWEFDKDNKPEKRKARKMIEMMNSINEHSFKGHQEVTCFTCHRGNPDPQKVPDVQTVASLRAEKTAEESEDNIIKVTDRLNTAEQIINKYISKIGGKDQFKNIKTLKYEGTVNDNGRQASVIIYKKAPDLFYYSVKTPKGEMIRGYNGKTAWEKARWGIRELKGDDLEALKLESDFYLPVEMAEKYSGLKLNDVSTLNGDTVYVVEGKASQHRNIKLYFNTRTGLLVRQVLFNKTPLGDLPIETDFKDYRSVNGIMMPFSIHIANYENVQDIKFENISANQSLDNSKFDLPQMN